MKVFFFYDGSFKPLRDRMVGSLPDELEVREDFIEDLGVMKNRAGGGVPTYLYKAQKIKDALDAVEDGEVFLFCDVDIQFFAPVREVVEKCMEGVDLVLQREFEDIGVNIGFLAIRNTPASHAFWAHIHSEIERLKGLDQRIVNNTLYSQQATQDFGLLWGRFPPEVWASSMAFSGKMPERLLIHHANFTIERPKASDPSVKLAQMDMVRKYTEGDEAELLDFVQLVVTNEAMIDYRDRQFGSRRPGPEWALLPEGHVARPGGFKEKKVKSKPAEAEPQATG
mmetsp:Transcript_33919/g.90946  ORF Transcript_33919/g.90946 Transcript_33919/m.90946 type:complete len:282 (+) Transcript_33919:49-894(+)